MFRVHRLNFWSSSVFMRIFRPSGLVTLDSATYSCPWLNTGSDVKMILCISTILPTCDPFFFKHKACGGIPGKFSVFRNSVGNRCCWSRVSVEALHTSSALLYGYIRNHKKTVKNGQARTRERKSVQKPEAKP
ncbi:hypothetical protein Tco_0191158 [Tanacetum coccineum]